MWKLSYALSIAEIYYWTKPHCLDLLEAERIFVCVVVVVMGVCVCVCVCVCAHTQVIECVSQLPVWQHCWVVWSGQQSVSLPPPPSLSPYPVALFACRNLSANSKTHTRMHTHTRTHTQILNIHYQRSHERFCEGKHYASHILDVFTFKFVTKPSLDTTEWFPFFSFFFKWRHSCRAQCSLGTVCGDRWEQYFAQSLF